jgi:hypothetical protein
MKKGVEVVSIKTPTSIYVDINLINNRYLTDENIWIIDESTFNDKTVVDLKTRAILDYILS